VLGPDHRNSLWAAAALTDALASVGEVEAALILGQETLQHSRRVLGPDHVITRDASVALGHALGRSGEADRTGVRLRRPDEPLG
jgi:hypothetical protein